MSAFITRELSFLDTAQKELKTSGFCDGVRRIFAASAGRPPTYKEDADKAAVATCVRAVGEPLMSFHKSWTSLDSTYDKRRSFMTSVQGALTFLVIFIIAGAGAVILYMVVRFMARLGFWVLGYKNDRAALQVAQAAFRKGGLTAKLLDATTVINVSLGIAAGTLSVVVTLWLLKRSYDYDKKKLKMLMSTDEDDGDGDDDDTLGLFRDANFKSILNASSSKALSTMYSCITGSKSQTCTPEYVPKELDGTDFQGLGAGLWTLYTVNVADFDPLSTLRVINRNSMLVRAYMRPMAPTPTPLSADGLKDILYRDIVQAILLESTFIPSTAQPREYERIKDKFLEAMPATTERVAAVILANWPMPLPDAYMESIDQWMAEYYQRKNMSTFYEDYLREDTYAIVYGAHANVDFSMQQNKNGYVSLTEFTRVNWRRILPKIMDMEHATYALHINIKRYVDKFDRNGNLANDKKKSLISLACNGAIALILILTCMAGFFLLQYALTTWPTLKAGPKVLTAYGTSLARFLFVILCISLLSVQLLIVKRSNTVDKLNHNNNALEANTKRLVGASENLWLAVKSRDAATVYSSMQVYLDAYSQCNNISLNNAVPFPVSEAVVIGLIMLCVAVGMYFVMQLTQPRAKLRTMQRLVHLKERVHMFQGNLPQPVAAELRSAIRFYTCDTGKEGVDILGILGTIAIFVMFILTIILVMHLGKSTDQFMSALNVLSANRCLE